MYKGKLSSAASFEMDEFAEANCRDKENWITWEGNPVSLWDGQLPYESMEHVEWRHEQARQLCAECPVWADCKAYVERMEKRGLGIDGVIAGRYAKASSY